MTLPRSIGNFHCSSHVDSRVQPPPFRSVTNATDTADADLSIVCWVVQLEPSQVSTVNLTSAPASFSTGPQTAMRYWKSTFCVQISEALSGSVVLPTAMPVLFLPF